jgi:hypothetical protein
MTALRARTLTLEVLPEPIAVCRLPAGAALPSLPATGRFYSVTRTGDELTLLVPERLAPAGARTRRGYRALKVIGPLSFEEVGIVASLTRPLAEASISLFVICTYETIYILVNQAQLNQAVAALRSAAHSVHLAGAGSSPDS